jgi:hypothetical protein
MSKILIQCAIAALLTGAGTYSGIDNYLKSVGATAPVRERMVGIVLMHAAPPAIVGAVLGIVAGALLPFGRKPRPEQVVQAYASQQLRRMDLPEADRDRWLEVSALLQADETDFD